MEPPTTHLDYLSLDRNCTVDERICINWQKRGREGGSTIRPLINSIQTRRISTSRVANDQPVRRRMRMRGLLLLIDGWDNCTVIDEEEPYIYS